MKARAYTRNFLLSPGPSSLSLLSLALPFLRRVKLSLLNLRLQAAHQILLLILSFPLPSH